MAGVGVGAPTPKPRRSTLYKLAHPAEHWLLDVMTDDDLRKWADNDHRQRRYILERRRWASATGRPINTYPRARGRSK